MALLDGCFPVPTDKRLKSPISANLRTNGTTESIEDLGVAYGRFFPRLNGLRSIIENSIGMQAIARSCRNSQACAIHRVVVDHQVDRRRGRFASDRGESK